jgi:hypothetical protein
MKRTRPSGSEYRRAEDKILRRWSATNPTSKARNALSSVRYFLG